MPQNKPSPKKLSQKGMLIAFFRILTVTEHTHSSIEKEAYAICSGTKRHDGVAVEGRVLAG